MSVHKVIGKVETAIEILETISLDDLPASLEGYFDVLLTELKDLVEALRGY